MRRTYLASLRSGTLLLMLAGCDAPAELPTAPTAPLAPPAQPMVMGNVTDMAFRPLPAVRVEVVSGPHIGLVAHSDASGRFQLAGTFDDSSQFRATKVGYLTGSVLLGSVCTTCPTPSTRYMSISMPVDAPVIDVAGAYTLAIDADALCTSLPEPVRSRRYAVTVTPVAPGNGRYGISLPGGIAGYDWFAFGVAGTFLAGWTGHDGPLVVEQVAPNVYVGFDSVFEATLDGPAPRTIEARMGGTISYCERSGPLGTEYSCAPAGAVARTECTSSNHRLTLTRR